MVVRLLGLREGHVVWIMLLLLVYDSVEVLISLDLWPSILWCLSSLSAILIFLLLNLLLYHEHVHKLLQIEILQNIK